MDVETEIVELFEGYSCEGVSCGSEDGSMESEDAGLAKLPILRIVITLHNDGEVGFVALYIASYVGRRAQIYLIRYLESGEDGLYKLHMESVWLSVLIDEGKRSHIP